MQAPGGPDEDKQSGFKYGGWQAPLWDDVSGAAIHELFHPRFDLLLGRKTYDIFASHWPRVAADPKSVDFDQGALDIAHAFNRVTKYVATHSPDTLAWQNSQALGADVPTAIRKLKAGTGPDLLTQGSSDLLQTLLAHDLIDEFRLFIYPLVLGKGKRFFEQTALPVALKLVKSTISPAGAVIATYQRAGEIQLGSFAVPEPSTEELARRQRMS
jgi:dihydrofolate reductase